MEFITKKGHSIKRRILKLDEREILALREAQHVAENIRIFVGEDEYGFDEKSNVNMKAANIEYGIGTLLANDMVIEIKETKNNKVRAFLTGYLSENIFNDS